MPDNSLSQDDIGLPETWLDAGNYDSEDEFREDIRDSFDEEGRVGIEVEGYGSSYKPHEISVKEMIRDSNMEIENTYGNYQSLILKRED